MATKTTQVSSIDDETPAATAAAAASEATQASEAKGTNHDDELSGDKKVVTIHVGQGDGGSDDVTLSLNGHAYQIKRGEPVKVPAELIEILDNAVEYHYKADGKNVVETKRPRFAYSVRG